MIQICGCGHAARLHFDQDGACGRGNCGCSEFVLAAPAITPTEAVERAEAQPKDYVERLPVVDPVYEIPDEKLEDFVVRDLNGGELNMRTGEYRGDQATRTIEKLELHELSFDVTTEPSEHTGIVSIDGEPTDFGKALADPNNWEYSKEHGWQQVETVKPKGGRPATNPDGRNYAGLRMARNRGRQRATQRLTHEYAERFKQLYDEEYLIALNEVRESGGQKLPTGRRKKDA